MTDTILVLRDGGIATVVLNRPEKLNALTKPMWQRLGAVFEELSADDSIRCVVIRGAGTKSFAPGNDISEFENERGNVEQAQTYGRIMYRTIDAISNWRHPVVAMIHGICVGGGLEIAGWRTSASAANPRASACRSRTSASRWPTARFAR